MADFLYYVNGQFVPSTQAAMAVGDLGFVRGYGVFDVLRTYDRVPFELDAHLRRLQRSADQIELALPWPLEALSELVHETLSRNAAVEPQLDVTIRIVVTGGASANFLLPEDAPSLTIMPAAVRALSPQMYSKGARLITVDIPRFMPSVKSINYVSAILGQKRARQAGAVEALYCTAEGVISECTTSNFFLVRGGRLITPDQDVLAGITRNVALELAADLGGVVLRPILREELHTADEAFITSTTKEILPIVLVDDVIIGSGRPGIYTQRLRALFRSYVQQAAELTSA
jgi:branched-chain amino acid aminotransferase